MNDDMTIQAPPMPHLVHLRPESAYRVAHDLLVQRAPREALAILEPALVEEPTNTGLRSLRAWAHLIQAHLKQAEAELRELVEETPDDVWARYALGRSLVRQSRLKDALPHLRLAAVMSADPEHEVEVLRVERRLAEAGAVSWDSLA
jgi:predicted Zn-dependent protease